MSSIATLTKKIQIRNIYIREILAEMFGTFILVALGDAAVAQSVLSNNTSGNFITVNFGWGFAVMFGVFVCGGVSGGHINPAVSVALATVGKFPWRKVPLFMIAQYVGAFIASVFIFFVYRNALHDFSGGEYNITTAGIWATYPQDFLSVGNGLADQVMGTGLLVTCVLAITDNKNMNTPKGFIPLMVGFAVAAIGMAYGYNCGYAINPARDLSPRIFTAIAGWGMQVFSFQNYSWWWIPVVGPHIGAVLGAWVYWLLVEMHWPEDEEETLNGPVEIVELRNTIDKH